VNELERAFLQELDAHRAWQHVETLVTQFPGRHSGSPVELESARYILDACRANGVDAEIVAVDTWLGLPERGQLIVHGHHDMVIEFSSGVGHGEQTAGELLLVESREEALAKREELDGRIVVLPYAYDLAITPQDAAAHGAIGMIYGNWGPKDLDILRVTAPQTWTYWGVPDPETFRAGEQEIPQIHIGRKTYEQLKVHLAEGALQGSFRSTINSSWAKTHMVVATVGPNGPGDEFSIAGCHQDSWSPGATDNGAGVGVLLEMARVFKQHEASLQRGIRFLFVSGHENGGYATSTWYLDNKWAEINDNAVVFSFTDTPGFANAPEINIEASEELGAFALQCARDVVGPEPVVHLKRPNKTADRGFYGIGVPTVYTRCAFTPETTTEWGGAFLGYWNHSDHDTLDKLDVDNLGTNMAIRALELHRLSHTEVLPYDFRPVVQGMLKRVRAWRDAGAFDLAQTEQLLEQLSEQVAAIYQTAPTCAKSHNRLVKALSRRLTHINHTVAGRYGQDIFGTPMQQCLVALAAIDELAHHEAASPMSLMLHAQIRRAQNRVNDALAEALCLLAGDTFPAIPSTQSRALPSLEGASS
jgi:hypothetical protein